MVAKLKMIVAFSRFTLSIREDNQQIISISVRVDCRHDGTFSRGLMYSATATATNVYCFFFFSVRLIVLNLLCTG